MNRLVLRVCLATLLPATAHAARPERVWGTYLGGPGEEVGGAIARDGAGNLYVCGATSSAAGVATPGAHQSDNHGGVSDIYLVKLSADGERVWATYLGGAGEDQCRSVAVAPAGDLVVLTGVTGSAADIATPAGLQPTLAGDRDGMVVAFDAAGARLWGSYLGSAAAGSEITLAAAFAADGQVHVAGQVFGPLPFVLPSAHQPDFAGSADAYLLRLDPAGALVWGTYYGGSASDGAQAIAVTDDAVYLAGVTGSTSGIATPGAHDTVSENYDCFVARLDHAGLRQWGTYFGGEQTEFRCNAAATPDGGVALSGSTDSTLDIATPGAFQSAHAGNFDLLLARLDPAGVVAWATYVGTADNDLALGLAVDPAGHLLLAATTDAPVGFATADALQTASGGANDLVLLKFDPAGARRWGTYLGGAGEELGHGDNLEIDGLDGVLVVGQSSSKLGITTPDALFQPDLAGASDNFLVRLTQGQGDACAQDDDCEAGSCVDGVCCDGPCGGAELDCQACSLAAGASQDGACTVLPADTACRPAAAECDAPELCPGDDIACPPDLDLPDATPCDDGTCLAGACTPEPAATTTTTTDDPEPTTTTDADTSTGTSTAATTLTSTTAPELPTTTHPGDTAPDPGTGSGGSSSDGAGQVADGGCGCQQSPVPGDMYLASLAALTLLTRRRRGSPHDQIRADPRPARLGPSGRAVIP